MTGISTIPSVCVFLLGCQAAGAPASGDVTCMLQNTVGASPSRLDRVSTLLEQTSLTADEQRELADMEQAAFKDDGESGGGQALARALPPAAMLEKKSAVAGEVDASYDVFQKPSVWGPAAWFFLHSVALAQVDEIPTDKQDRLRRFFVDDLAYLLPCPACVKSVQDHVNAMEIEEDTFASRDSVFEFVWALHNLVNADEGVPDVPFDEAVINYAQAFDQGVTDLHFESVTHVHNGEEVAKETPAEHSVAEVPGPTKRMTDDFLAEDNTPISAEDRRLELLTKSGVQSGVTLADIFPFRLLR